MLMLHNYIMSIYKSVNSKQTMIQTYSIISTNKSLKKFKQVEKQQILYLMYQYKKNHQKKFTTISSSNFNNGITHIKHMELITSTEPNHLGFDSPKDAYNNLAN